MDLNELARAEIEGGAFRLTREDLEALLDRVDVLREDPTGIAGRIRTLRFDGTVLVQERNPEGEYFLRTLGSEERAARFVESRLRAYERMWDG